VAGRGRRRKSRTRKCLFWVVAMIDEGRGEVVFVYPGVVS